MEQKYKRGKTPEIPPFSQDDEWWNKTVAPEAVTELENVVVKHKQMTSSLKAISP